MAQSQVWSTRLLQMHFGLGQVMGQVMRNRMEECQKQVGMWTRTWLQLVSCTLVAHDVLIWRAESDRRRGRNRSYEFPLGYSFFYPLALQFKVPSKVREIALYVCQIKSV